ncbi:MAG: hypothetical protein LBM62_01820 [Mediterranea sp.]|jgi:hypothetical protein|nr:hypothetical protein [Mediterranea sp.]
MTQREQVIEAMKTNGGYATFGQLNQLVDFSNWGTKTPYATIRRIVQENTKTFFKIRSGLWALNEEKNDVLLKFQLTGKGKIEDERFTHSYYQGLIVEIGNMKGFQTYIPSQDKNKKFLETPLKTIASITSLNPIPLFTHEEIRNKAKTVDVIWLNERKFPDSFFEVEHSTDMKNSLLKFFELQDFYAHFKIIADGKRQQQFENVIHNSIFIPIQKRVKFVSYKTILEQYEAMCKYSQLGQSI